MTMWYAIQVRPSFESSASDSLKRAGYSVFCPMASIRGRRFVMFSGYLFVTDPDDVGLSRMAWAWHVIRILGGPRPTPIPQAVIDVITGMEEDGAVPLSMSGSFMRTFTPGEFVRVVDGVMRDLTGIVSQVDGDRVSVVLDGAMRAVVHAAADSLASA